MDEPNFGFPLIRAFKSEIIPLDRLNPPEDLLELFSRILVTRYEEELLEPGPGSRFEIDLSIDQEVVLELPGLNGFSLVIGGAGRALIMLGFQIAEDSWQLELSGGLYIRFPRDWLRPVVKQNGKWIDNPSHLYTEIMVGAGIIIDQDWNVMFDGPNEFILRPSMIADTGFVIEATVAIDFSESYSLPETIEMGLGETWRGVILKTLTLHLPDSLSVPIAPEELTLTNFHIGSGGISGSVSGNWSPTVSGTQISGSGTGTLFGMSFGLKRLKLDLLQNAVTDIEIKGVLGLPYFDHVLDVELGFDLDGNISIIVDSDTGIAEFTLSSNSTELIDVKIEDLNFELYEGVLSLSIGGNITPKFGGLDWPTFDVKKLSIDSEGNVHLEGGWLDLREQYSLDFHGFKIEITKLGFGKTEDGGKWIGFSGGLKLADGIKTGASVEGLRITWYDDDRDPKITFNGVGVEFEVPEVLRFKGAVSYRELEVTTSTGAIEKVHRFDGDIELNLISLNIQIDGTLVVGSAEGPQGSYTFLAIYLGAELPAGIPLWATGLSLYGIAGLFALQMEPDKHDDEEWYEGWYKRPEIGVTDLKQKWINRQGSLALGAGVTIGTAADLGFAFSGKMLLVIVFPGPILLIEGKANVLKKRAELDKDPTFRALAVLDNRAGTFSINLDAQYKYGKGGELIDIRGGAEAFFDFNDANAWHLYLGEKEPPEKRIRADIFFKLFKVNAYLMLDAQQLAMGVKYEFGDKWDFKLASVTLESWIDGNAILSWKPTHFYGDLWLHGSLTLSALGLNLVLTADARIAADVFDPFHILAQIDIYVDLGVLGKLDKTITLEWGPTPKPPPLPLPLKEIAIEHFKVTTSWPLPRNELLLPNYDQGDGFLVDSLPKRDADAEPPFNIPVVPLDCRPHLTFGRTINDDCIVSVNPNPPNPEWELIGDPTKNEGPVKVRYGLNEIALSKWNLQNKEWIPVARKGIDVNPIGADGHPLPELYGSWAPVPQLPSGEVKSGTDPPVANVKLWLWSKTPFDYTRHTGGNWYEWFTNQFSNYPCVPDAPVREFCYDFSEIKPGQVLRSPWSHPDQPNLHFSWDHPHVQSVTILDQLVEGLTHALCFPSTVMFQKFQNLVIKDNEIMIYLPEPVDSVRIIIVDKENAEATGFDAEGNGYTAVGGLPTQPYIEVDGKGKKLVSVRVRGASGPCILGICTVIGPDPTEVLQRDEMTQHLTHEMARWSQEGEVLEPHTIYQLKVVTTLQAKGERAGALSNYSRKETLTEYAYFRTEGPPGLAELSKPINHPSQEEFESGLDDLTRYVHQTVPATVPATGEMPSLPRPVYRAYDVGVEFNEDYVDLLYRLERRDLGLYLYDSNNRPVRDAQGRLIVLSNRWGKTEELTLTEAEKRWIITVNESECVTLDPTVITHDKKLISATEGQVLDPDTVYEARLVPLLLHDDFSAYSVGTSAIGPSETLNLWKVNDEGTNNIPSHWEIREEGTPPSHYLIQKSNIWGGITDGKDPVKPGTMLIRIKNPNLPENHPAQPKNWTDYRMSVYLRSKQDGAIGVVFRYRDSNDYYRFSMDRQQKYRRVVKVVNGRHTILAEDNYVYRRDREYLITIEAIGSSLRIYQDGELIWDLNDDSIMEGGIGLYCWGNMNARFSDIRVDDFRENAPVAYRFKFTTSQFANFFHHLHTFQDERWIADLSAKESPPMDTKIAAWLAEAVKLSQPDESAEPSDKETRAYEELAMEVLGQAALQNLLAVEVTRVEKDNKALAFLIRSPEPIDWRRTNLKVLSADRWIPHPELPGDVKLTDVTFGASQPNEESVTMLLREATNLTNHRIEYLHLPGPLSESIGDPPLFVEDFEGEDSGVLFRETFDSNALDRYIIVDEEGTINGPSNWSVSDGHIIQTSDIYGESVSGVEADKPGTIALTGSKSWANVRISSTLRSNDINAIGIVFRYQDENNYYRFSMELEHKYRRLIKRVNGVVSVLWEDNVVFNLNKSYQLVIETFEDRILCYLDDILIFNVQDVDIEAGCVGFYCWRNAASHFEELSVEALESSPLLWLPALEDLSELKIVDEAEAVEGPSFWSAENGILTQSSNIQVEDDIPHQRGTYALGGNINWKDVHISGKLRSDTEGVIGVMFRVVPQVESEDDYTSEEVQHHNYYRFSMDTQPPPKIDVTIPIPRLKDFLRRGLPRISRELLKPRTRRLIKKFGNTVTVLWKDHVQYNVGQTYDLTIHTRGNNLRGYLDGTPLFDVRDDDLKRGRIGLYCSANRGAHFEHVIVTDRTRRVGQWNIVDEGTINTPSEWRISNGALLQTSNIHGGSTPNSPGTYVVTGDLSWTDYQLNVHLRSDRDGAIGVIFRYVDEDNYYRLSLDTQNNYRRLIKKEKGKVSVLWQEAKGFNVGEPFTLTIDVIGSHLTGYLGEIQLFSIFDRVTPHLNGRVGLYSWNNSDACFERVEVRNQPLEKYALFRDRFADGEMSEWFIVDKGTVGIPSAWSISEGELRQTSKIQDGTSPDYPGTHIVTGDLAWKDIIFSSRLKSLGDGAIGVMFRYSHANSYYRFSMDSQRGYRRLMKNVGGKLITLWEDDIAYEVGRTYELTIVTIDNILRGYLDGVPMFVVEDRDLAAGRIGLYCWGNDNACFSQVQVYPAEMVFKDWLLEENFNFLYPGEWTFVEESDYKEQSQWEVTRGELSHTWDNGIWSTLGSGVNSSVLAVATSGNEVYVGGYFTQVIQPDGTIVSVNRIARWDSSTNTWSALGSGVEGGIKIPSVHAIAIDGNELFVGGDFTEAGGVNANFIAKWNSFTNTWSALGSGLNLPVIAIAISEDAVYAGCKGTSPVNANTNRIARWDRSTNTWSTLGGGVNGSVSAIVISGNEVYVGGYFTQVIQPDGTIVNVNHIAKWDSSTNTWSALGNGVDGYVSTIAVSGNELYVGEHFIEANMHKDWVTKWDGSKWSTLGSFSGGFIHPLVKTITVSRNEVYVGGEFTKVDGINANNIAMWNGSNWSALGSGLKGKAHTMTINGNDLYLGGAFKKAHSIKVNFVAKRSYSDIEILERDPLDAPENYALAGDTTWTDYRFSVHLRWDYDSGTTGVMFRYQNKDNYYHLLMSKERYYLIKMVAGEMKVLWDDIFACKGVHEYILTIDCVGDRLTGYVNGVQLFTVGDSDLKNGYIGLYSQVTTIVSFAEVRVAASKWMPYYIFGHEVRLPAGTRVQIYGGNARYATPEEDGSIRRFIASLDGFGRLKFPIDGFDLRLVTPEGAEGHKRHFIPDSAYEFVDARVLRKVDGTGFFIVVPSASAMGSQLSAAQYRLKLTYRRNNREIDPDSQIFSQVGDNSEEQVVLDIPWKE